MQKRRRPTNWFRIGVIVALIGAALYFNQVIVPTIPTPFSVTGTPTRNPESYIADAESNFQQGKLTQAIEAYQQAIRSQPDDAAVYIALARVQVFAGQYSQAQVSTENALLLNPNSSMAHALRGWALEFQGDYLQAETSLQRALELDPNNALAHAYYAELLADQFLNGTGTLDGIDRAAEASRVAISLAPGSLEAHRARGYVLEVTGNYEEAIREYEAANSINNNLSDIHLALGRTYRALGVYDKSVESLTRANALNPTDPLPDLIISRIYGTLGEFSKAEQYAEQAVRDAPADPTLHGNYGVMLYRNNKWPEAVTQLAYSVIGGKLEDGTEITPLQLVVDSPRVAEYYFTYGLVLVRLQRCGEALPIFQQILGTIPSDEISVFNANEGIRICAESALNNSETLTTPAAGSPEAGSPTPEVTTTP